MNDGNHCNNAMSHGDRAKKHSRHDVIKAWSKPCFAMIIVWSWHGSHVFPTWVINWIMVSKKSSAIISWSERLSFWNARAKKLSFSLTFFENAQLPLTSLSVFTSHCLCRFLKQTSWASTTLHFYWLTDKAFFNKLSNLPSPNYNSIARDTCAPILFKFTF